MILDLYYRIKCELGRTHLGHLLKPGDAAMGYDLSTAIFNDADLVSLRGKHLPDFV